MSLRKKTLRKSSLHQHHKFKKFSATMIGRLTMADLLRNIKIRKYSKSNWKVYEIHVDINTPFQQMKKKDIERFDVWKINANGEFLQLVEGNNRKQAVIKGMEMGVINGEGQYKLMWNANPNFNKKKNKTWRKYNKRWRNNNNKRKGKSSRKSRAWWKLKRKRKSSKTRRRGAKYT